MRSFILCLFVAALALVPTSLVAQSAADDASAPAPWIIGTREAPPFAFKQPDGTWTGLSIDLWQHVADRLGFGYELREMGAPETLIDGVADGTLDASIAAITVTAERAERVDFSHPFHASGLGIAVPADTGGGWWQVARAFLSLGFLQVILALTVVLLAAAFGVWLFERKRNAAQFGGTTAQGIGAAFWWSAVTMTTVGYGDKAPVTLGGRLVALVWMFTSVIIISTFTAQIASSLTVGQITSEIRGPGDLPRITVATVGGSAAENYLRATGARPRTYPTVQEALAAVAEGSAAACVYDAPILQHYLSAHPDLTVLPNTFERRDYAVALPLGSDRRREINVALLEFMQSDAWTRLEQRYLGPR